MEVDKLATVSNRKLPINILNGIFLKSVFFLNPELTKCVIVGIFKERASSLGILLHSKKHYAFFPMDIFNQMVIHFTNVKTSLKDKKRFGVKLSEGQAIDVKSSFGKMYVSFDSKTSVVSFNENEFNQFMNNLTLICSHMRNLFLCEDTIKQVIHSLYVDENPSFPELPFNFNNQIFEEVLAEKQDDGCS